jgi:hypothetical protein
MINVIASYVRGELAEEEFERSVYSDLAALEAALGEADAVELYLLDFKNDSTRAKLKCKETVQRGAAPCRQTFRSRTFRPPIVMRGRPQMRSGCKLIIFWLGVRHGSFSKALGAAQEALRLFRR